MPDCPTPARVTYQSEGRAWGALRGQLDRRPYRCACGGWHLATLHEAMRKRAGRLS